MYCAPYFTILPQRSELTLSGQYALKAELATTLGEQEYTVLTGS